jgi:hypothetical protein
MKQKVEQEPRNTGSTMDLHRADYGDESERTTQYEPVKSRSWLARTRKKLGGMVAYSVTWHRAAAK